MARDARYDSVDRDALHAPVIDRAIAEHARPAEYRVHEHVVISERGRHALVGRAEDGRHRDACGRRKVHGARVIRDERAAPAQHANESTQVGAGMSYVRGAVHTEAGELIASFAQDALIRPLRTTDTAIKEQSRL